MGNRIGQYELRGELGRGAMAIVWRAWDPALEREVAIKEPTMPAGADTVTQAELAARFVREGRAAGKLNHPGIVTIYGADIYEGRPAIVMELLRGETLSELIDRGRLAPSAVAGIIDQLLDAIGYAHRHGIVHRDIKPDNVFVTEDGRVKLADFGIAHVGSSATLTQAGTVIGTPGYMSPEQVTGGAVDSRSDLFSVGVIAYELLTGRNPFGATDGSAPTTIMYRIVHEQPQPPEAVVPDVPGYLGAIISRALAKDPAARYQSAEDMQADLRAHSATTSLPQPGSGIPRVGLPAAMTRGGNALFLGITAAGLLVLIGLTIFATSGSSHSAPPAPVSPAPAEQATVPAPEPEPAPAPEPPPPDPKQEVRDAIDQWVAGVNNHDIDQQMEAYADSVDYFGNRVSRSDIYSDKLPAYEKHSSLSLSISNVSISVSGNSAEVTLVKTSNFLGGPGKDLRDDVHSQRLRLQKTGQGWKIVAERDLD